MKVIIYFVFVYRNKNHFFEKLLLTAFHLKLFLEFF